MRCARGPIQPEFKERDRLGFVFMANDISSERRAATAVRKVAELMRQVKGGRGRIVFVAGPVVVHTGGGAAFSEMIRGGYVSALLSGNALAVHDIEHSLFGTSLGVDLERGVPLEEGHKNHMRAINTINRSGSIRKAVESGVLRSGVMYECVKREVPFVLAGSIRDDGPLPDTIMDLVKAQELYSRCLEDARMVVCLSSMLHSIGVGNMLAGLGSDGVRRYQSCSRYKIIRQRFAANCRHSNGCWGVSQSPGPTAPRSLSKVIG